MRPSVYEYLQIGKETTPGTAVDANVRPRGTRVAPPRPVVPTEVVGDAGGRADSDLVLLKESSEWNISGDLSLADLAYWFSGLLGKVDIDSNVLVAKLDQDTAYPYSFTMEFGNGSLVEKAANCRLMNLSLSLPPNQLGTFQGTLMGGKLEDGATRTASPVPLKREKAGPKGVSLWIASTASGLTTSDNQVIASEGLLDLGLTIGPMVEPLYTVAESDQVSDFPDVKPSIAANVTFSRDSSLLSGFMTGLRAGTLYYARILAKGPTVSSVQSVMDIRFPFKFREPAGSENQNVYSRDLVMQALYDGDAGSPLGTAFQVSFTAAWIGTDFGSGGALEGDTLDTTEGS